MIPIPACRVATSPGDGRVTSLVNPNTSVMAGDVVGVLQTAHGSRNIVAPGAGLVGGPLVRNTQQVAAGEAVLWLARI
jgi:predicted deacylase